MVKKTKGYLPNEIPLETVVELILGRPLCSNIGQAERLLRKVTGNPTANFADDAARQDAVARLCTLPTDQPSPDTRLVRELSRLLRHSDGYLRVQPVLDTIRAQERYAKEQGSED